MQSKQKLKNSSNSASVDSRNARLPVICWKHCLLPGGDIGFTPALQLGSGRVPAAFSQFLQRKHRGKTAALQNTQQALKQKAFHAQA